MHIPSLNPVRWWQEPEETLRKKLYDALVALRHDVENQNSRPSIIVKHLGTVRERQLTAIHTTRVEEWEFGYQVKPLNEQEGFFVRTVYIKLHGGKLDEINKRERQQLMDAVTKAVLDEGTQTFFEAISDTTMAIRQPFAVMFWKEGNENVVTPSMEYFKKAFKAPLVRKG